MRSLSSLAFCVWLVSQQAHGESALPEQLAREIRVPRLEFREATVSEGIDFLRKKSKELLGDDRVLNLNLVRRGDIVDEARITCSFSDTPLLEILQFIAQQTNLTLGATHDGIYLYPTGGLPPETKGLREIGWNAQKTKLLGTVIYATARKDAFSEAAKLVEDAFGGDRFKAPKEARDAIDALRKRAEESGKRAQEFDQKLQKEESDAER